MPRLTLKECAYLLNADVSADCQLAGFCVDTRLLKAGDLFFALPGSQTDGHHFLEQAAAAGAAALVVSSAYRGPTYGLPYLTVPDVLDALQGLAKKVLAQSAPQVVAITGSVGKTTTKDFVAGLLKGKFATAVSPGNSNSQIGLPLAILNHTTGQEQVLVLEMGLTVKGNIARLVEIAPPDIAMITTTGLVHAQNFESLEEIGIAKAEIFSHPKTRLGILHRDITNFADLCLIGECFKVSFSTQDRRADYFLEDAGDTLSICGDRFSRVVLNGLSVPAKHNRHNFLAAATVARHLGMQWSEIEEAAARLTLPERRMELREKGGILFVNDSYNASELSVKAALESLPAPDAGGKRIAVLGEMLELGKFSDGCHKAVGEHALKFVDAMVCYGDACRPIADVWKSAGRPVYVAADYAGLVHQVKSLVRGGDVVLLKGSRAKGMWKVLDEF